MIIWAASSRRPRTTCWHSDGFIYNEDRRFGLLLYNHAVKITAPELILDNSSSLRRFIKLGEIIVHLAKWVSVADLENISKKDDGYHV